MIDALKNRPWSAFTALNYVAGWAFLPVFALAAATASAGSQDRATSIFFIALASVLTIAWIARFIGLFRSRIRNRNTLGYIKTICDADRRVSFASDSSGNVVWSNAAAEDFASLNGAKCETIAGFLVGVLPNALAATRRLASQAQQIGASSERFVSASGPIGIQVQKLDNCLLWRCDFTSERTDDADEPGAMLTVGRKGTILFMNAAAKALIGERITTVDRLFLPGSDMSSQSRILKTSNGQRAVRVREQTLQGDRSHLFLTPVESDHNTAELPLAELPVPLLRLGLSGDIEHANEAALALLNQSDVKGSSLTDIFEGFALGVDDWIAKTKAHAKAVDSEFLRVRGQEKETFVQVILQRVNIENDSKIVAMLSDATKLKSLEAQFVQSQKMQAIGQLAGGVAHDFNNLLTAISGHCDLMLLRHDPGDQDYADLMQVHQNANRAAGLVSQLLAFSRKQTLQLEQMDIRNTLSDLTHLLNRLVGETVTLTLSHDPILKPVRADKRQLEQVIMNLVVNARDAMPNGGEITIETESMSINAPMRRQRVTVPNGEYVVVRVRDEGTGIAPDALQKIFEPFYTTKRTGEGTGLGLSTAYGIVKQTGGYIFADSELGQGTCFSLLFPASDEPTEVIAEPIASNRPLRLGGQCSGVVLLVEDEAPVRAFASRALSMRGFEVVEAESAEQALDLLADKDLAVDVFVTDVVMPGMDGPTWVRKALSDRPNVKVVFVSGYAEGAFEGGMKELPNAVFLPKPFSLTDLTTTVQNQLA